MEAKDFRIPIRPTIPCGRTTGHGESCSTGWECPSCAYVLALERNLDILRDRLDDLTRAARR